MSQLNVVNNRQLWSKVSLAQYMNEVYHGVETTRGTFFVSHNGTSEDEWQYAVKKRKTLISNLMSTTLCCLFTKQYVAYSEIGHFFVFCDFPK